jgi:OOP family OmpA-OmpF porin
MEIITMLNRSFVSRTAAVLALAISAAASATESGFYLGANYGQSMFSVEQGEIGIFAVTTSSSIDDSDTAWSISAGYRFNPYLGVELAYRDLGQVTIVETGTSSFPTLSGRINGSVGATGTSVVLVGTLPFNKFEFFGKLGAMFAKTDLDVLVTITQGGVTQSGSDGTSANTTETVAGLGVGYSFTDHVYMKLEWERIPEVGDQDETGEGDVGILSLGFQYRF